MDNHSKHDKFTIKGRKLTWQVSLLFGIPNAEYQQGNKQQDHYYPSNYPSSVYVTLKKQWGSLAEEQSTSGKPLVLKLIQDESCIFIM